MTAETTGTQKKVCPHATQKRSAEVRIRFRNHPEQAFFGNCHASLNSESEFSILTELLEWVEFHLGLIFDLSDFSAI